MRFTVNDADKYGNNGGGKFFSLADDNDIARVRIMYNGIEDVDGQAVHEIEVNGYKRYVACLRSYDDPLDVCPLCAAGYNQLAKVFIPLYVMDETNKGEVRIWERGKAYLAKIVGLCGRYSNLVSHIFEIERHGKRGDTNTSYEIYEMGHDETKLTDLPEIPDVLGTIVLEKSADELTKYLNTGRLDESAPQGVVRGSDREVRRRTPANNSRRREEF